VTFSPQVEAYLLAFAEAYGLERFVQCRTRVTNVEPLPAASTPGTAPGGASSANGVGPAPSSAAPTANGTGPVANGSSPAARRRWRVTSEPTADDARLSPVTVIAAPDAARHRETEEFEAVVVCNGHYSEPRLPPDSGPPRCAWLLQPPVLEAGSTALHAASLPPYWRVMLATGNLSCGAKPLCCTPT